MKVRYQRRLVRLTTLLAVMVGLSVGSTAMAETKGERPKTIGPLVEEGEEKAPAEPEEEEGLFDFGSEGEDLPGAIEELKEHVEAGLGEEDDVVEYVREGAKTLADAIEEILPEDNDPLETSLDAWKDRLESLEGNDNPELFAALTGQLFQEGADLIGEIQQSAYPEQGARVSDVRRAAEAIDASAPIDDQVERVNTYFSASEVIVEEMYRAKEAKESEEPLTQRWEGKALYAAGPGAPLAQAETDEEGVFEWGEDTGADLPSAVEDFDEFVQEHREEGIDHVADYTREGTKHFFEAMDALVPEEDGLIREQLANFEESADALEDTPRMEYPTTLRQTLTDGTQLLTTIQQAHYPEQEMVVRELYTAVEQLDVNRPIEDQVNEIQNVYIQASRATQAMGPQAPEEGLFSARPGAVVAEAGEGTVGEPEEMEEPREWDGEEMEEGDIGSGPIISGAVRDYVQYAENLTEESFGEDAEATVIEGLRMLDQAIMASVEEPGAAPEDPTMEEPMEEPDVQPMQAGGEDWEGGMDDPGMEPPSEDPSMEDPELRDARAKVNEERQKFTEKVNELEGAMGEENFNEVLGETMEVAGEVFTTIQETEQFNVTASQVDELKGFVEDYDVDTELLEQAELIVNFFQTSSGVVENIQDPQLQVRK